MRVVRGAEAQGSSERAEPGMRRGMRRGRIGPRGRRRLRGAGVHSSDVRAARGRRRSGGGVEREGLARVREEQRGWLRRATAPLEPADALEIRPGCWMTLSRTRALAHGRVCPPRPACASAPGRTNEGGSSRHRSLGGQTVRSELVLGSSERTMMTMMGSRPRPRL